jgi:hypothetical protein
MDDRTWSFEEDDSAEPAPRRPGWRVLYAVGVAFFILILLAQLTGISQWILSARISGQNLVGRTEAEIIERMGKPDHRSLQHAFNPEEWPGFVPRVLTAGDPSFSLSYEIGPRIYVFHFVPPQVYARRTGNIVLGADWIVLEYHNRSKDVIY